MSEEVTSEETSSQDRRRSERIGFVHSCRLEVLSPAWAINKDVLEGETENITDHGLRVNFSEFDSKSAEAWQEAVFEDTELEVQVVMSEMEGDLPPLKGQIVWVHCPPGEDSGCSVGILFSIMSADQSRALHELIASPEE